MVESNPSFSKKNLGLLVPIHEQTNSHEDLIHLPLNYRDLIVSKIAKLDIELPESQLEILESPKPHNGSDALYFLEQFIHNDWVLVSLLGPNRKTSRHLHAAPVGAEEYYFLAGEAILTMGEKEDPLNSEHNFRVVPSNTPHQLKTRDNFALTLIIMKNAKLAPEGKLHIPVTS